MSSLQPPDIVMTKRCRANMVQYQIAVGDVLSALNKPQRVRKANPTVLTDSVWRAETRDVGTYYRWSSTEKKWIILSCWRSGRGGVPRTHV
jgi:hypothetical protein